jgi:hypothetical protein
MVATAASTIHLFTGNNIAPKGDLASRSLTSKLEADRPDPANRQFTHPDPVEWTLANRKKILGAMFTILLGNPILKARADAEMETRFKTWYRLVGSAVEYAAAAAAQEEISFKTLFIGQDDADEDAASLSEVLVELAANFSDGFDAKDVASFVNDAPEGNKLRGLLREFLFDGRPPSEKPSSRAVGKRLARHVGDVVRNGKGSVVLRAKSGEDGKTNRYWVEFVGGDPPAAEETAM